MQDKHIKYKLQRTAKRERKAQHTKGTNTYTHNETGSNLQRFHDDTRNYWRARFVDHWRKSSLSELVRSSGPPLHSHRLPLFNHPVKSVILPLTLSQTRMVYPHVVIPTDVIHHTLRAFKNLLHSTRASMGGQLVVHTIFST